MFCYKCSAPGDDSPVFRSLLLFCLKVNGLLIVLDVGDNKQGDYAEKYQVYSARKNI